MNRWNRGNRLRYSLWAPACDLGGRFDRQRHASLGLLDVKPGECCSSAPARAPTWAVATDLTFATLVRARGRLRPGMGLAIMDGHELTLPPESFDAVVLHLIVAVISDPVRCLQEVERVLRPGGRAVVFEKFVKGGKPPLLLRAVNVVSGALFTKVTRNFENILGRARRAVGPRAGRARAVRRRLSANSVAKATGGRGGSA